MLPIETALFCFMTASILYWTPYFIKKDRCLTIDPEDVDNEFFHKGWCKEEGTYNPIATLLWASESQIIKNIIGHKVDTEFGGIITFLIIWYLLTITTYGTNVPAGLFLPGMIIGCAIG